MSKQYGKMMSAAVLAVGLLVAGRTLAGSLDPTNAPGPTMHTLQEIYQKVENLAPQTLQTLSSTTTVVNAGYYAATNLTAVDADLAAGNIKTNVTIFGIAGTLSTNAGGSTYAAPVPQTGQTTLYQTGDDGDYEKGVAWPNPRFTIGTGVDGTNRVTDNLTGLVWARNANMGGTMTWSDAIVYCEALNYGGETDWRFPNLRELQSLFDYRWNAPALCDTAGTGQWSAGDPFTDVPSAEYWSSTTYAYDTGQAWHVQMSAGSMNAVVKSLPKYVWPVRGGE